MAADGRQGVHRLHNELVVGGGGQVGVAVLDLVLGRLDGGIRVGVEHVGEHLAHHGGRVDLGVVVGQLRGEDDLVGQTLDLFVGLHNGDLDVEGGDLVGQRVAVALERPRGRRVHGHARRADVPADAGQDDDVARVLGAELGQRRLDEVDLREEDGLELVADESARGGRRRQLLDSADDGCTVSQ